MADRLAGHWVLISNGSVERLQTFFRGCREQGVETNGVVVAPPKARLALAEANLDWPAGWSLYSAGPLYSSSRQEWLGLLWDDQCPESPRWDVRMVEQVLPWRVVTSQEASQGDWASGALCWGVQALEEGGGLGWADLYHSLRQWAAQAIAAQIWQIERSVQLPRHEHNSTPSEPMEPDQKRVTLLKALMGKHGARIAEPDWSGVSLMISTPSMASRPEAMYMISLFNLTTELRSLGVRFQLGLERYNADIGLARSHIISEFLRSDFSHLLMIDDDMTFEPSALHRLVYAEKDLVAVAGPKKRYPLIFAASHVDEDGQPCHLQYDTITGTAEVTHVGTAFMLISRACAEQMRDAFPELEYVGGDGKVSWGLFLQGIVNKHYQPEDFSFCERWRRIGGKVYICPDVPLGHIGAHEFRGDLMSNVAGRSAQQ